MDSESAPKLRSSKVLKQKKVEFRAHLQAFSAALKMLMPCVPPIGYVASLWEERELNDKNME